MAEEIAETGERKPSSHVSTEVREQGGNQQETSPKLESTQESIERVTLQLEERIKELSAQVTRLENSKIEHSYRQEDEDRVDYAEISGILLASVAVILTTLGVVIAIFSFIGYAKIKTTTVNAAEEAARKVVLTKINETVNAELIKVFSDENLNLDRDEGSKSSSKIRKVISDAVAKVIYRDIYFKDDSSERGEETDE
jgi:hypothetical protein